jgi:hypothetical protein
MITLPTISTVWIDGVLYIKGIYQSGTEFTTVEGYTVEGVTLQLRKDCDEECGEAKVLTTVTLEATDANEVDEEFLYGLTPENFELDEYEDGVYHVQVDWELSDEDITVTQSSYTCNVLLNELKCDIVEYILNTNDKDNFLVNSYNAINYALACGDCCKVCEIYKAIKTHLSDC